MAQGPATRAERAVGSQPYATFADPPVGEALANDAAKGILAAVYQAVNLPVPWHYRAPRDTRTIFDAAGIDDHSAWLAQYATGTVHHALDDAICQARAVCAAWATLAIGSGGR